MHHDVEILVYKVTDGSNNGSIAAAWPVCIVSISKPVVYEASKPASFFVLMCLIVKVLSLLH